MSLCALQLKLEEGSIRNSRLLETVREENLTGDHLSQALQKRDQGDRVNCIRRDTESQERQEHTVLTGKFQGLQGASFSSCAFPAPYTVEVPEATAGCWAAMWHKMQRFDPTHYPA